MDTESLHSILRAALGWLLRCSQQRDGATIAAHLSGGPGDQSAVADLEFTVPCTVDVTAVMANNGKWQQTAGWRSGAHTCSGLSAVGACR